FYARPRLGLTEHVVEADVRLLFDRQGELGRPRNPEVLPETTRSVRPAARRAVGMAASAGIAVELAECPLLVLPSDAAPGEADARVRGLAPDDPDPGQGIGAG